MADGVVLRIITATHDDDGFVAIETGLVHVHACDRRPRPALAELRRRYTPLHLRGVLVGDVERIKAVAAAAHAEDEVYEVAVSNLYDTIIVAVRRDRHDVAIDAVLLEGRIRVKEQVRQLGQELLWHEGPEFLAGRCIHRVQVTIVGGRVDHDIRIGLRATVYHGCWLRVQWIAHLAAHGSVRIEVDVGDVLTAGESNELLNGRLAS